MEQGPQGYRSPMGDGQALADGLGGRRGRRGLRHRRLHRPRRGGGAPGGRPVAAGPGPGHRGRRWPDDRAARAARGVVRRGRHRRGHGRAGPGAVPRRRPRVGDARTSPAWATAAFDLVVFSFNGIDSLDHADRLLAVRAMRRVVAPGGRVVFSTFSIDGVSFDERPWTLHGFRTGRALRPPRPLRPAPRDPGAQPRPTTAAAAATARTAPAGPGVRCGPWTSGSSRTSPRSAPRSPCSARRVSSRSPASPTGASRSTSATSTRRRTTSTSCAAAGLGEQPPRPQPSRRPKPSGARTSTAAGAGRRGRPAAADFPWPTTRSPRLSSRIAIPATRSGWAAATSA